ncbi:DoxX family protein [Marivirga sp. S37H4]|uniref:DoxX family protein n=1 Tax=Marivirga aurantiaca TaxID=2802615 RepID=A0A934WZX9_9BACT|nr:DoxX family protein [Marivirga aurantiaca]MBK6266119.1 DoxX family protein [Marivirga aurantiaca]
MVKKTDEYLDRNWQIGILLLRIFIGLRLLYGVVDNIISWQQMIEFSIFLENNGFPFPLMSAVTSVYVQFIGGLLILLGYKIRVTSFILIINFLVAFIVHLLANDTVEGMTPALAMLFGCLTFLFTGPGKLSVKF